MKHLLILILSLISVSCYAQSDFETFAKKARSEFNAFKDAKEKEYEDFRKRINEEYANFMRKSWKEYDRENPVPKPIEENPVPPVVIPEEDIDEPIEDNPVVIEEVIVPEPEPVVQPEPVVPIQETPPAPLPNRFSFSFLGGKESVSLKDRFSLPRCDENSVADVWTALSQGTYDNLISDCLRIRRERNLCDWAYLQMLQSMSEQYYGKGTNEAALLASYVYCQSGYSMRLAVQNNKLKMLFASKHKIYGMPYFTIDGTQFYIQDDDGTSSRIFSKAFTNEKDMSLYVNKLPKIQESVSSQRRLKANRYSDMDVTISTNKNLIDFYNTYPSSEIGNDFMTRWAMYANTPLCSTSQESLYPSLKSKIAGMNQLDAVNKLLNWVQTAFVYEYDDKVWGGDRAFFADETLYYPYCDCEDRSILFSRLVRDLVGLDVVLIYYPGHLATAVAFTEDVKGDYLMINGRRFIVSDPTYIGAPVGSTMPKMDNASAKVILLERK